MMSPGVRIREVKPLSFIYEVTEALPADVCLEAIRRFEANTDQQYAGRIGQAGEEAPSVKRSTDLRISGRADWRDIDRTLSQQLVATYNELAGARFVDGRLSAGAAARRVKNNQELDAGAPDLERLNRVVMGNLVRRPFYRAGALRLHVASPLYARYLPGMNYGDHLDDPIMGADTVRYRSDVAVTIFLNAPEEYDGGELVIRAAAGDAVLYPAGSIHHVNPVTRGERLVAVTWVQSLVRGASCSTGSTRRARSCCKARPGRRKPRR
jgi:PKHD-type hydroxylase